MAAKVSPELKNKARDLWKETNELQRIFISIIKKSRANRE